MLLVGTTSSAQPVTLTDVGSADLSISSIVANGDFTLSDYSPAPCGAGIAGGSTTCQIYVTFTPTATGPRTGSLTITDNASGSPHLYSLTGTGIAPVAGTSPPSLTLGSQNVGTTSASQAVTLSNSGDVPLTITSITPSALGWSGLARRNANYAYLLCPLSSTRARTDRPDPHHDHR